MTAPASRLRLHRLRLVRHDTPASPWDDEPVLPGVLEVGDEPLAHLLFCPDAVTLVTSLWYGRPYGARGQMLRPVLLADTAVRLEAVWSDGGRVLAELGPTSWYRELTALAGVCADVLAEAGEDGLRGLLAPVLAGRPPAAAH